MTAIRIPLQVQPMADLEWADAIEQAFQPPTAASPAESRCAWIHHAAESEVLTLYRAVRSYGPVPAPWWLRAVAAGRLRSRSDGFRIEDRIHALLSERGGWEYVPWAPDGESGYWEFLPSENTVSGHGFPTTVSTTDRHDGWIDVLPAHVGPPPHPVAVAGLAGLAASAAEFEALR